MSGGGAWRGGHGGSGGGGFPAAKRARIGAYVPAEPPRPEERIATLIQRVGDQSQSSIEQNVVDATRVLQVELNDHRSLICSKIVEWYTPPHTPPPASSHARTHTLARAHTHTHPGACAADALFLVSSIFEK